MANFISSVYPVILLLPAPNPKLYWRNYPAKYFILGGIFSKCILHAWEGCSILILVPSRNHLEDRVKLLDYGSFQSCGVWTLTHHPPIIITRVVMFWEAMLWTVVPLIFVTTSHDGWGSLNDLIIGKSPIYWSQWTLCLESLAPWEARIMLIWLTMTVSQAIGHLRIFTSDNEKFYCTKY